MPLSFDNIENAFAGKTNKDLNRAYWLFKAISNNFLVKIGPPITEFAIKIHLPVKSLIKATIFKHFCGGEYIDDTENTVNDLWKQQVGSILDYSVEGREEETEFDKTSEEIIRTVIHAKGDKRIPFCVFKVTGIGRFGLLEKVSEKSNLSDTEKTEWEKVKTRVNKICKTAFENNVRIFIDAEESWIQQAIDDLADDMMMAYNKQKVIVYNTIQLYRTDRLAFMKKSFEHSQQFGYKPGFKLVRGAYMEKERARALEKNYPSPIQPDKLSCDADYDEALKFCIQHIDKIAICAGTHNEKSSMMLTDLMLLHGIPKDHQHVWFSQLLGMSDHISFNLAKEGYNVCKYVPYGPVEAVLPYLFRRAAENTSISGQMGRELSLLIKERQRRKKIP